MMGCEVYANNNEISCKAGGNKAIADMPDVCLSPPSPPAGPVPVPYPNTSFSKDMKNGSKTVKIKGKEVMLKDQSFYKSSPLGDEAATRSFGANVITHVITGKTYCLSWSMDVKVEGKNVSRHLDLTTSNHASKVSTAAPMITAAQMNAPKNAAGLGKQTPSDICGGEHSWECDKYSCPDCWPVPCARNAKQEEKEYKATQGGTEEEKIKRAHNKNNAEDRKLRQRQQQKGQPVEGDPGARFESAAIQKAKRGGETIERTTYWAHCSMCHLQQEVDLVTDSAIKEVKRSATGFKSKQMRYITQIRDECFPDKNVVMVTRHASTKELEELITKQEWQAALGHDSSKPIEQQRYRVEDP